MLQKAHPNRNYDLSRSNANKPAVPNADENMAMYDLLSDYQSSLSGSLISLGRFGLSQIPVVRGGVGHLSGPLPWWWTSHEIASEAQRCVSRPRYCPIPSLFPIAHQRASLWPWWAS